MNAELAVKTPSGQETYPLRGERVTIGRGVTVGIRIADSMASREHCVVERVGDRFVLRDLSSANGTRVNGVGVHEHALEWGDRIQIGETVLVFLFDRKAQPERPKTEVGIGSNETRDLTRSFVLGSSEVDVQAARNESFAAEYLNLFHELSTAVTPKDTAPEVCATLLKTLRRSRRYARSAVVLMDPATGEPGERFAHSEAADERIQLDGGELLDVWRTGRSVFNRHRVSGGGEFVSMLVPLRGREATHGVLYLDDREAPAGLKETELHLVGAVGAQVGLLLENIRYARRLRRENENLQNLITSEMDIVGESAAIQRVMELVRKVAATESTVLIRGESGTGKELVARAIHFNSPRRSGPLEVANCASLPPALVESELFGHEKGAFTGATARRRGRFEVAGGGTLFLDEVGELALDAQATLLRVLEERKLRRVGGTEQIAVDVRVVAATHRDLSELVGRREFREDLFYRLNVVEIALPPLRERRDDVLLLVEHFMKLFSTKMGKRLRGATPAARSLLERYPWPGNVRELRNAMERATLLGAGEMLDVADFPGLAAPAAAGDARSLEDVEREHIARVLAAAGGNKTEAARVLGVNRSTLYEKLERYRIASP